MEGEEGNICEPWWIAHWGYWAFVEWYGGAYHRVGYCIYCDGHATPEGARAHWAQFKAEQQAVVWR